MKRTGEVATCHVCGAAVKVTRRDHPDTFGNVIHAYAMVCPANPGHVRSQWAVAVAAARTNSETAAPPPKG